MFTTEFCSSWFPLIIFFLNNLTILPCLIFPHNHFQKLEGLQEQEIPSAALSYLHFIKQEVFIFWPLSCHLHVHPTLGVDTLPEFPFSLTLCIKIAVVNRGFLFHAFCSQMNYVGRTFSTWISVYWWGCGSQIFTVDLTSGILITGATAGGLVIFPFSCPSHCVSSFWGSHQK